MEIEIEERAWILIELTFFKGEKISERAKILQCVKTGSTSQQMSVDRKHFFENLVNKIKSLGFVCRYN